MPLPENHAQLFTEICGQLRELSPHVKSTPRDVENPFLPPVSLVDKCRLLEQELQQVSSYSQRQNEALQNLMQVAEQKMVELKMALDRKTNEAQVLAQENAKLLELIRQYKLGVKTF